MKHSDKWVMLEWCDLHKAWIITVDSDDDRPTPEEVREVIGKDPFIIRINTERMN